MQVVSHHVPRSQGFAQCQQKCGGWCVPEVVFNHTDLQPDFLIKGSPKNLVSSFVSTIEELCTLCGTVSMSPSLSVLVPEAQEEDLWNS